MGSELTGLHVKCVLTGEPLTTCANWLVLGDTISSRVSKAPRCQSIRIRRDASYKPMLRFSITLLSLLNTVSGRCHSNLLFFLFGSGTLSPNEILRLPSLLKNAALMLTDDN